MKSLNGTWDLKVVKGIDGKKEVPNEGKNGVTLHVRNRYDFINLKDNVTFKWSYNVNRKEGATDRPCLNKRRKDKDCGTARNHFHHKAHFNEWAL